MLTGEIPYVHCHKYNKKYNKIAEILERNFAVGVSGVADLCRLVARLVPRLRLLCANPDCRRVDLHLVVVQRSVLAVQGRIAGTRSWTALQSSKSKWRQPH